VQLASQIADALHAAHEHGILHRDLKPANVMVVRQGETPHAKLLDFGVAQLASSDPSATRTVGGEVMGTPAYMSPEQVSAKPLDARSDVFSFGAVLYELLAGTRAFTGDSAAQILSAVLRDDPKPLEAPPALQQIVRRCLAKDPDRRFPTMADVRQALQHLTPTSADVTASIAVLPFANLSRDADDEYFSDGLSEEIINALTQVRGLNLLPRVGLEHEALDDARTAVELDPGFWLGWADLGLLYARRQQHPEAMQCAERAMAGSPWCPYSIGVMAAARANQGHVNEAQPLLDGLRGDAYGGPVGLAVYSLARGEIEQAVEWSAKAVEQRFPAFIPRLIRAFEPSLRRSAAWPGVLKKMNLA
jgi:tetratricopeptide (TPR) repeat protein